MTITMQNVNFQEEVYGIFQNENVYDPEANDYVERRFCQNLGLWTNETDALIRCEALNLAEPSLTEEDTYEVGSIKINNTNNNTDE